MRSISISTFAFVLACSGNSLDVGSDESTGGTGGDPPNQGGNGGYGAGQVPRGGSSSGDPAQGGEPAQGGAYNGGATAAGGVSVDPTTGGSGGSFGGYAGVAGGATTGGLGGTGSNVTTCAGDFPLLGVWEGHVLDFFYEPVETVRLVMSQAGAGGISGTFTWGEGSLPAPATDPDATYPPGYDVQGRGGGGGLGERWPGFPYTVSRGAECDGTFRFMISTAELWESWCALQEPVYTEGFGYRCMLMGNGRFDETGCYITAENGDMASYTPAKCNLCGQCVCDETRCSYTPDYGQQYELDLLPGDGIADGDVLTGTDGYDVNSTIRLERVE